MKYQNKETGEIVKHLCTATDDTSGADGKGMVVYCEYDSHAMRTCESVEFYQLHQEIER